MEREIGVASAKALEQAEIKMFTGGGDSSGFDLGSMLAGMKVSNKGAAEAVLNRLARPNDLGINTSKPLEGAK